MSEKDFIHGINVSESDKEVEKKVRPIEFGDFSGQEKIVQNLKIFVQAAKMRGEALDHVLLHGPPGLGNRPSLSWKTSRLPNACWPTPRSAACM